MLAKLFSLQGRLDRRGFLLWYLTAFCLVLLPGLWTRVASKALLGDPELLERLRLVGPAIGLCLLALWLWTKTAVSAKRLRDMGCRPAPFLIVALALPLLAGAFGGFKGLTLVSVAFGWLFAAALLFWPGRRQRTDATIAETFA